MKTLLEYLENSEHNVGLMQFVYEGKLNDDDIQRVQDNAKYFADACCLNLAAIDFYEMILKGEDKSTIVEFMQKISGGVRMYNANVPGSIKKYAQSETNVTDGDWRGWYTSVKGYVTKNDWYYDNKGEKDDFYDEILKNEGSCSWTMLNKQACENLYEMFLKYLSDKKVCKSAIKQKKDNFKNIKTQALDEIKRLVKQLKDSKNPDYVFTPKVESIDEKIRGAEHEVWLGKLNYIKYEALIHICNLLKTKDDKEATKFILESLRTLENFKCDVPPDINSPKPIYDELGSWDLLKIYQLLAKATEKPSHTDKEIYKQIDITDSSSSWKETNVHKFIDLLDDMVYGEFDSSIYDSIIKEFKKEQTDKNYTILRAKKSFNKLKELKAQQESEATDMNDKNKLYITI